MALPSVVTYSLATASSTALVNASGTVAAGTAFTQVTTVLDAQRRVLFTPLGNESSNTFTIRGTNGAGFPIVEALAGANATTFASSLDFKTVSTIIPSVTTASTLSVGTNGTGSTLWHYVDWGVTPTNIEASAVVTGTANYSVQYTYDDPNNLPAGVSAPQPFNHPTMVNATTTLDGPINDPVMAVRLFLNSGGGSVRFTVMQAGIASP